MIVQEPQSRKDRPGGIAMHRPRLGPLAVLYALLLIVAQVVLVPPANSWLIETASHVWLSSVWAGWAAAVWVLVRPPLTLWRSCILGLMLAWHCLLVAIVRDAPPERYLIMFGGYGVLQSTAAMLMRLPRWTTSFGAGEDAEPRPGQFGIFNLVVLTTVVALVLLAIRRYGDAGGDSFLPGTAIAVSLVTLVAASAIAAATLPRWGVAMLPLTIILSAAAAAILAAREVTVGRGGEFIENWRVYAAILGGFGLMVFGFGVCGRIDAQQVRANDR